MSRLVFALPALVLAAAAAAAPAPRERPEDALRRLFGTPIDPDKDCEFTLNKTVLRVQMPDRPHVFIPDAKRMNAPRVVRPVAGDFAVRVKVRLVTPIDPKAALRAGLIVWQDPDSGFINGCEYGGGEQAAVAALRGAKVGATRQGGFRQVWQNGQLTGQFSTLGGPFSEPAAYYRVVRKGGTIRSAASVDGAHWHELSDVKVSLANELTVGVFASHNGPAACAVEFEDFAVSPIGS